MIMLTHEIGDASEPGRSPRNWSTYNDRILFEILINLLNDENWREDKSPYVRDLLKDINRLSKSPALKPYKNIIQGISKESNGKEKAETDSLRYKP